MAQVNAVGRRKTSTARVYLQSGTGEIIVNGRPLDEYFDSAAHIILAKKPLTVTETEGQYDVKVTVRGGGKSGQAGAVQLGIARALNEENRELFRPSLKKEGMLTRDSRMVERKKYGQPKARKNFQFSKR
jgi:small subunit ribosomal protein S9